MSTASMSFSDDSSRCVLRDLPIEHCTYRGEGNANLVVALLSEHKVIRLKKSVGTCTSMQEDLRRVRREVNFIRDVISTFLADYVCVPEIFLCSDAEIARLSEKIHLVRPENRRNKAIIAGYATVFPDYAFLPQHLSTFSNKPTFCVEIKPKQGFVCELDRQFINCPYCLTQYYKIHTGTVKEASRYCPFDLFSGNSERMDSALQALLQSPQNNLRIFKDGVLRYSEEQREEEKLSNILTEWFGCSDIRLNLERFLCLVKTTLMRPFSIRLSQDESFERLSQLQLEERSRRESAALEIIQKIAVPSRLQGDLAVRVSKILSLQDKKCEYAGCDLPRCSVLERILRMQKLHLCGADAVSWIYANCSTLFTDDLLFAEFLDSPQSAKPIVRKTDNNKKAMTHQVMTSLNQQGDPELSPCHAEPRISIFPEFKSPQCTQNGKHNVEQSCLQHLSVNDCLNILENYLLFCTAKDCSILMAFQEIDKETSKNLTSEHIVNLSTRDQQIFLANARVLDLDMKSLRSIEKHQKRDNSVLEATIEKIEKHLH